MENSEPGQERRVPTPQEAHQAFQALIGIFDQTPDLKARVARRDKPFNQYHYDGLQVRNWERDADMMRDLGRGIPISAIAERQALSLPAVNSAIKAHMNKAYSVLDQSTKEEFRSGHQFPQITSVTSYVRFVNRTSQKR